MGFCKLQRLFWSVWLLFESHRIHINALSVSKLRDAQSHPRGLFAGADIEQEALDPQEAPQVVGDKIIYRGKVNEIDYCIAPSDVSLSSASGKLRPESSTDGDNQSLTRALNNASNRAVRRILLAKSWPSEEDFNLSLRLAATAEQEAERIRRASSNNQSKCPVPRPILNLLRPNSKSGSNPISKRPRTNQEYVADQIVAFRERYGTLAEYSYAEAYLESILSLATTGDESPRVQEVLESKVYGKSYKRVISVLKSVGVVLEDIPDSNRFKIASKLQDQNICLSMIDVLTMREETSVDAPLVQESEMRVLEVNETDAEMLQSMEDGKATGGKCPLRFWGKEKKGDTKTVDEESASSTEESSEETTTDTGVILCSDEPTMTRQLNSISNIVRRALLFGGDQELLVLSETLSGNLANFVNRWYPSTSSAAVTMEDETRPGVQYMNALISLLRIAYKDGIVTDLNPLTPLSQSYGNSYERLVASLVEDGSGYIQAEGNVMAMPKPRTATEELGRFAVWESAFRSKDEATGYPDDLEGTWEVKDEVGGETIGISSVTFLPNGEVSIPAPLEGLRWRLDPGPTHLDTCTFQVLAEDGTVLQYRGFIDRGARLEARFSGRPIRIRGSVMFQMRYLGGSPDYWKEMLPVNYMEGATKFEMKKKVA